MSDRQYWIISKGKHELGYPIGETLFRGTKQDAENHALEIGNVGAKISKAIIVDSNYEVLKEKYGK